MGKLKKALVIYFIVSSLILHGIVALAAYHLLPAMRMGYELGEGFARASAGQATNVATVKDISTLQEGDYTYVGYALDYKGQMLYAMGGVNEGIAKGDTVAVTVTKHPFEPVKGLLIMITKNGH